MKLGELYKIIIKEGRRNDPINLKESLFYSDSAILYGSPELNVKTIFAGIDIGVGEMLLADRLRKEKKIDVVLSHHPHGIAQTNYTKAMQMQTEILGGLGLKDKDAKKYNEAEIEKSRRRIYSSNCESVTSAARLLNLPFMCIHTPADNMAWSYLTKSFKLCKCLEDIIEALLKLPEYRYAASMGIPPFIVKGRPKDPVGKLWLDMTGGNSIPPAALAKLHKQGVKTIVSMHLSDATADALEKIPMKFIVAGHMASDSLGMNLLLDRVLSRERLVIVPCGGFNRISHLGTLL